VAALLARLAREADDAGERAAHERAEDRVRAVRREPRRRALDGRRGLGSVARRERVGVLGEPAQAQRAVGGCVGRNEAPDRNPRRRVR
jgi:hypothetical protein